MIFNGRALPPWLRANPQAWPIQRAKTIFAHIRVLNSGRSEPNILSLTLRGVVRNDPDDPEGLVPSDYATYQIFEPGDLVLKLIDLENIRTSRVGLVPERGIMSSAYVRLRPITDCDARYFYYQFYDLYQRHVFNELGNGVRSTLGQADVLDLPLLFPPLDKQRTIADYLDRETARIDALIAAKRRMVELLEERWAETRRRVTRVGVQDDDSPWVQLRRVARLQAGAAFPHDKQGDETGTIPYVKVGDLSNVDVHDHLHGVANRVSPEVAVELRSPVLPAGTIVMPKIGAALLTNRRAILSEASCLDQNVMGVIVHVGEPRFVYYCLASTDMGPLSTPGPVPLLNEEAALSVRIPWPSIGEQARIVKTLDAHSAGANAPADVIARQVNLLGERRHALITAAVTGQLEVSEAA